jgi:hypothetical protein
MLKSALFLILAWVSASAQTLTSVQQKTVDGVNADQEYQTIRVALFIQALTRR